MRERETDRQRERDRERQRETEPMMVYDGDATYRQAQEVDDITQGNHRKHQPYSTVNSVEGEGGGVGIT